MDTATKEASETLKQVMITTPVLALLSFNDPFFIETDACKDGIGAIL